jgi:Fur family iron response transcriptional regulator
VTDGHDTTQDALTAEALKQRLTEAGLRATRPRLALYHLMSRHGERQFTAETLQDEAREAGIKLSLATVYNTLKDFGRCGLLHEIATCGNRIWFDTKSGSHCHYYCRDEDTITDAPSAVLDKITIPTPAGYEVARIEVIVQVRRLDDKKS